eukprot:ANDGO_00108.mRNA.1 hypothetical protein
MLDATQKKRVAVQEARRAAMAQKKSDDKIELLGQGIIDRFAAEGMRKGKQGAMTVSQEGTQLLQQIQNVPSLFETGDCLDDVPFVYALDVECEDDNDELDDSACVDETEKDSRDLLQLGGDDDA